MTPQDLHAILDENFAPWVRALNLDVRTASSEMVLVRMPLDDQLMRVGGIVSGQALAALADTSMVLAAISHADAFVPVATTDLHTQFLRPGSGAAILCEASIVRAGRALSFARADMREENSAKIVATATATFYLP